MNDNILDVSTILILTIFIVFFIAIAGSLTVANIKNDEIIEMYRKENAQLLLRVNRQDNDISHCIQAMLDFSTLSIHQ